MRIGMTSCSWPRDRTDQWLPSLGPSGLTANRSALRVQRLEPIAAVFRALGASRGLERFRRVKPFFRGLGRRLLFVLGLFVSRHDQVDGGEMLVVALRVARIH